MEASLTVIAIVFVSGLMIAIRLCAGSLDRERSYQYIEDRKGKIRRMEWLPFGSGWFASKERIYQLFCLDADGNEHEAVCKTSWLAGVYLTEDRITRPATTGESTGQRNREEMLERENRALRERLRQMESRNHF